MPTYQYRCRECGDELEAFQKFTDPALTECPSCTGELRKVFSAVGVVFKGSGFYATDSRKSEKSSTQSNASSESKSSPSESKPAASATSGASSATPATSSAPAPAAAST